MPATAAERLRARWADQNAAATTTATTTMVEVRGTNRKRRVGRIVGLWRLSVLATGARVRQSTTRLVSGKLWRIYAVNRLCSAGRATESSKPPVQEVEAGVSG